MADQFFPDQVDGAYINIAFIELLFGGKLGKLVLVGIPKGGFWYLVLGCIAGTSWSARIDHWHIYRKLA